MKLAPFYVIGYGFLSLVGGVIGFYVANSFVSLLMGGGTGIALIICGKYMREEHLRAYHVAFGVTLLLTLFFFYRFILTLAILPAGLMMVLGSVTLTQIYKDYGVSEK